MITIRSNTWYKLTITIINKIGFVLTERSCYNSRQFVMDNLTREVGTQKYVGSRDWYEVNHL